MLRALNDLGDVIPVESRASIATLQRAVDGSAQTTEKKDEDKKEFVAPAAKALLSYWTALTEKKPDEKDK